VRDAKTATRIGRRSRKPAAGATAEFAVSKLPTLLHRARWYLSARPIGAGARMKG